MSDSHLIQPNMLVSLQQNTYLVLGPALAMLKYKGPSCLSSKLDCSYVCACVDRYNRNNTCVVSLLITIIMIIQSHANLPTAK